MDGGVPDPGQGVGPNQLSTSARPNELSASETGSAPPAPPAPPPVAEPARRGAAWKGVALRIGIIGAIVGGGLIFRDRLTGSATDLAVGDCFDEPAAATEVSEVQHRPCTEAHDAEVVFVGDYTGSSYPVVSGFDDYAFEQCVPAFEAYVGRSFQAATELDMSFYYPTLDGWGKGDREVTCYLLRIDRTKMTASMKAAGG